jgi:hypothetical protein
MSDQAQEPTVDYRHTDSAMLQCRWMTWGVWDSETLVLTLPAQNVPDMTGTIRVATFLLPEVKRILVVDPPGHITGEYAKHTLHNRWVSLRA